MEKLFLAKASELPKMPKNWFFDGSENQKNLPNIQKIRNDSFVVKVIKLEMFFALKWTQPQHVELSLKRVTQSLFFRNVRKRKLPKKGSKSNFIKILNTTFFSAQKIVLLHRKSAKKIFELIGCFFTTALFFQRVALKKRGRLKKRWGKLSWQKMKWEKEFDAEKVRW